MKLTSLSNTIFFKVGIVFSAIILIHVFFTSFFIAPKITSYLMGLETKQAKIQLDRISEVIVSQEKYLKEYESIRIKENRENIRNISYIASHILDTNFEMYKDGLVSKEAAFKNAIKVIKKIDYKNLSKYIYILDTKGNLVFHPDKRYQDKNVYNVKDAKGQMIINEIIENTTKNQEVYSSYFWTKLDSDLISEKTAHSLYNKSFDLIISNGFYLADINTEVDAVKEKVIKEIDSFLNSISSKSNENIFVVNSENKIVLHPNERVLDTDISKVKEKNSQSLLVNNIKNAFKNKQPLIYNGNKAIDVEDSNCEKIAFVNYNSFFDWYIVSSMCKNVLEEKAKEINYLVVNVSLLLLLIFSAIAILFIKKLLNPMAILSKNANLVKDGNLKVRNKIKSKNELGLLGEQFDKMLDSIEENTKNLESKVEDRTAQIRHKLLYDELTGLKNRVSLINDLKNMEFCSLSLIDIDAFDDINELYGLEIGNEVLIKVKEVLNIYCEKNKLELYRLNSDVFAILDERLEKFTFYDSILENIQALFKDEISIDSLDIELFIYVTIGTSIAQKDSIKKATIALKKAKKMDMKYLVYNKSIDTKDNIRKTIYWREKIKKTLKEDRVVPFFQPIVNKNQEIIKYETLMRLYDEVDFKPYYMTPGTFIDVALKTKQYFKLNQEIIRKAIDSLDLIKKDISINISFLDIMNLQFYRFIEEKIDSLPKEKREKIVFEILESDQITDYEILDSFIMKFRQKGIRIAIDDFGTGYSNFSHILKIKPDFIKIDGSLIKDINNDEKSFEMVKSIIAFSKSLEIKVIAEFVHSKEVFEKLKELEIDEFQGYYLGEPKPLI